jgi:hypothetical protein
MDKNFEKVKNYILDLEYAIVSENVGEALLVISKEEAGIVNMIVDCEDSILIIEQQLFDFKAVNESKLLKLLQMNRKIVHGAFVIDDTGKKVIFRDTLQLESLDLNELAASINSLEMLLAEYGNDIIELAK